MEPSYKLVVTMMCLGGFAALMLFANFFYMAWRARSRGETLGFAFLGLLFLLGFCTFGYALALVHHILT